MESHGFWLVSRPCLPDRFTMRSLAKSKRTNTESRPPLLAVIAAVVMAACGFRPTGEPPVLDDVRVTCGEADLGIPGEVKPVEPLPEDAAAALGGASEQGDEVHERVFRSYEWGLASRSDEEMLLYGHTVRGGQDMHANLRLERDSARWIARSWNKCHLRVDAPAEFHIAAIGVDPTRAPSPDDTELHLLLDTPRCADSAPPTDEEVAPTVAADDERVVITVLVQDESGIVGCPAGSPPHSITVTLDEPVGDRALFDGRHVPLEDPLWAPSPTG